MKTSFELAREFIAGFENKEVLSAFDEEYTENYHLNHIAAFIKENLLQDAEYLQLSENYSFTTAFYVAVSNGVMVEFIYFQDTLHPWAEECRFIELTDSNIDREYASYLASEEMRGDIERHKYGWKRDSSKNIEYYKTQQRAYILGAGEFPTE